MSFQSGAPFWSTSSPSRICLQGLTRAHAGHRGHWPYLLLGTVRSPWNSHLLEEFLSEDLFIFNSLDPTHYRMWLNKKCCHYPSLSPFFILFSLFNWLQRSRNGMFTPLKRLVYSMLPTRSPRSPVSCSASGAKKNRTTAAADGPGLRPIPTWGNNHFCDRKNEIWKWGCGYFFLATKIWWCTCTNIFGNVTGRSWDTPWMGLGQYRRDDHAWKRRWRFTGHSLSGLFKNWVAPVCINYHIATPKRIEKIVCHNF